MLRLLSFVPGWRNMARKEITVGKIPEQLGAENLGTIECGDERLNEGNFPGLLVAISPSYRPW